MKIYRIKLSNKDEIVIPEEKLNALLLQKEQLVKVTFENKDWELINKAHIINAKIDYEETRRRTQANIKALSEPELTDEQVQKNKLALKKIRDNLFPKQL